MLAGEMATNPYKQSLKVDGRREGLLDQLGKLPFEVPPDFTGYIRHYAGLSELIRIGRSLMKSLQSFEALLDTVAPPTDSRRD